MDIPQGRRPGQPEPTIAASMAGAAAAAEAAIDEGGAMVRTDFRNALLAARDDASRRYLVALMRQFGGNVTQAADRAGMTRENLHRLLRKYGVQSETFKQARRQGS